MRSFPSALFWSASPSPGAGTTTDWSVAPHSPTPQGYNAAGVGPEVWIASTDTVNASYIGYYNLYQGYVDILEYFFGTDPTKRLADDNIAPYTAHKIISGDTSINSPLTRLKGAILEYTNVGIDYYSGEGFNYYSGVIFKIATTSTVHFRGGGQDVPRDNTRNHCINMFDNCEWWIALGSGLVFGERYPQGASENCFNEGFRGTVMDGTELVDTVIKFTSAVGYVDFQGDATLDGCTFTSTEAAMPYGGFMRLGSSINGGDKTINFTGCVFDTPLSKMLAPSLYIKGRAFLNFDGCVFPNTNYAEMLSSLPDHFLYPIQVNFRGYGVSGSIDPNAHEYYTARCAAIKTSGVYRAGSLPDVAGGYHSYHVTTKQGLSPLLVFDELPHITTGTLAGRYVCSLYIAVPSTQLLYNDEVFIRMVGPDEGNPLWKYDFTPFLPQGDITVTGSTQKSRDSLIRTQYPVVAMSWTGLPGGWVTQKIPVILSFNNNGKLYCIPFVSKSGIEFTMCPTIGIEEVL